MSFKISESSNIINYLLNCDLPKIQDDFLGRAVLSSPDQEVIPKGDLIDGISSRNGLLSPTHIPVSAPTCYKKDLASFVALRRNTDNLLSSLNMPEFEKNAILGLSVDQIEKLAKCLLLFFADEIEVDSVCGSCTAKIKKSNEAFTFSLINEEDLQLFIEQNFHLPSKPFYVRAAKDIMQMKSFDAVASFFRFLDQAPFTKITERERIKGLCIGKMIDGFKEDWTKVPSNIWSVFFSEVKTIQTVESKQALYYQIVSLLTENPPPDLRSFLDSLFLESFKDLQSTQKLLLQKIPLEKMIYSFLGTAVSDPLRLEHNFSYFMRSGNRDAAIDLVKLQLRIEPNLVLRSGVLSQIDWKESCDLICQALENEPDLDRKIAFARNGASLFRGNAQIASVFEEFVFLFSPLDGEEKKKLPQKMLSHAEELFSTDIKRAFRLLHRCFVVNKALEETSISLLIKQIHLFSEQKEKLFLLSSEMLEWFSEKQILHFLKEVKINKDKASFIETLANIQLKPSLAFDVFKQLIQMLQAYPSANTAIAPLFSQLPKEKQIDIARDLLQIPGDFFMEIIDKISPLQEVFKEARCYSNILEKVFSYLQRKHEGESGVLTVYAELFVRNLQETEFGSERVLPFLAIVFPFLSSNTQNACLAKVCQQINELERRNKKTQSIAYKMFILDSKSVERCCLLNPEAARAIFSCKITQRPKDDKTLLKDLQAYEAAVEENRALYCSLNVASDSERADFLREKDLTSLEERFIIGVVSSYSHLRSLAGDLQSLEKAYHLLSILKGIRRIDPNILEEYENGLWVKYCRDCSLEDLKRCEEDLRRYVDHFLAKTSLDKDLIRSIPSVTLSLLKMQDFERAEALIRKIHIPSLEKEEDIRFHMVPYLRYVKNVPVRKGMLAERLQSKGTFWESNPFFVELVHFYDWESLREYVSSDDRLLCAKFDRRFIESDLYSLTDFKQTVRNNADFSSPEDAFSKLQLASIMGGCSKTEREFVQNYLNKVSAENPYSLCFLSLFSKYYKLLNDKRCNWTNLERQEAISHLIKQCLNEFSTVARDPKLRVPIWGMFKEEIYPLYYMLFFFPCSDPDKSAVSTEWVDLITKFILYFKINIKDFSKELFALNKAQEESLRQNHPSYFADPGYPRRLVMFHQILERILPELKSVK